MLGAAVGGRVWPCSWTPVSQRALGSLSTPEVQVSGHGQNPTNNDNREEGHGRALHVSEVRFNSFLLTSVWREGLGSEPARSGLCGWPVTHPACRISRSKVRLRQISLEETEEWPQSTTPRDWAPL